jgi:hypothetical protein
MESIMSRCNICNLEIIDETEQCPLCGSVLEHTIDVENMYPDVKVRARKLMLISRIYLFVAIIVEVILVYANIVTESDTWWSIITGLIFFYCYMLLRYAILGRSGYRIKVLFLSLLAILMLVAIDFVSGYRGWSLNYVMPALIMAIDAAVLVLMFVNRRSWQSYMMIQIAMIIVAIIPVILYIFGIVTKINLALAALATSVFLFLGTLIIGDRRARVELYRRFHIR